MKLRKIKFIGLFFAVLSSVSVNAFSQGASLANRRTALRCLSLAESYIQEQNWSMALSQCVLGINYDDSISDLWYVLAASSFNAGKSKAEVLPLVEKSLSAKNWVNYNKDAARLLYADILCDTLSYDKVLSVLDEQPAVFSADAEYVRIKALYRIGSAEAVSQARNKIDGARRIYPDDTRFPLLFFKFESPSDPDKDVKRLSQYFLSKIVQYVEVAPDKDAELEIYATRFAEGEQKERLLKSFSARDLRHPLYAVSALEAGVISQKDAFRYMTTFSDDSVNYEYVQELCNLLSEPQVLNLAKEYFTAYSGVLLYDTDGDGINNLYVKYSRGRPETVFYDSNQDGVLDWNLVCDFGVPVAGTLTGDLLDFKWSEYPYVESVDYRGNDPCKIKFSLVGEALSWTPVSMDYDNFISKTTGYDFYFPTVKENVSFEKEFLFKKASKLLIESNKDKNVTIDFSVLDGNILYADYFVKNIYVARAVFKDNLPELRVVDTDGDGVFETTEFYSTSNTEGQKIHTFEEEQVILHNIYGYIPEYASFYLKMVQIDTNKDTVPDFTEEYFENNSKITSWDTDGDGNFNVRHIVDGNNNSSLTLFYVESGNSLMSVKYEDSVPSEVSYNEEILSVHKDSRYDFYWIGDFGLVSEDYYKEKAKECLLKLDSVSQAETVIVSGIEENYLCIRVGNFNYGFIVSLMPENPNEEN